jgi:hypothetical protein
MKYDPAFEAIISIAVRTFKVCNLLLLGVFKRNEKVTAGCRTPNQIFDVHDSPVESEFLIFL